MSMYARSAMKASSGDWPRRSFSSSLSVDTKSSKPKKPRKTAGRRPSNAKNVGVDRPKGVNFSVPLVNGTQQQQQQQQPPSREPFFELSQLTVNTNSSETTNGTYCDLLDKNGNVDNEKMLEVQEAPRQKQSIFFESQSSSATDQSNENQNQLYEQFPLGQASLSQKSSSSSYCSNAASIASKTRESDAARVPIKNSNRKAYRSSSTATQYSLSQPFASGTMQAPMPRPKIHQQPQQKEEVASPHSSAATEIARNGTQNQQQQQQPSNPNKGRVLTRGLALKNDAAQTPLRGSLKFNQNIAAAPYMAAAAAAAVVVMTPRRTSKMIQSAFSKHQEALDAQRRELQAQKEQVDTQKRELTEFVQAQRKDVEEMHTANAHAVAECKQARDAASEAHMKRVTELECKGKELQEQICDKADAKASEIEQVGGAVLEKIETANQEISKKQNECVSFINKLVTKTKEDLQEIFQQGLSIAQVMMQKLSGGSNTEEEKGTSPTVDPTAVGRSRKKARSTESPVASVTPKPARVPDVPDSSSTGPNQKKRKVITISTSQEPFKEEMETQPRRSRRLEASKPIGYKVTRNKATHKKSTLTTPVKPPNTNLKSKTAPSGVKRSGPVRKGILSATEAVTTPSLAATLSPSDTAKDPGSAFRISKPSSCTLSPKAKEDDMPVKVQAKKKAKKKTADTGRSPTEVFTPKSPSIPPSTGPTKSSRKRKRAPIKVTRGGYSKKYATTKRSPELVDDHFDFYFF